MLLHPKQQVGWINRLPFSAYERPFLKLARWSYSSKGVVCSPQEGMFHQLLSINLSVRMKEDKLDDAKKLASPSLKGIYNNTKEHLENFPFHPNHLSI